MGKVITNKIVVIKPDESVTLIPDKPVLITADGPAKVTEPMHLNEETVLVFDENGNCIGNIKHEKVKELR